MKTKITFLSFAILFSFSIRAQEYKTGIGVRLGGVTQGLTVKHFINSNSALEGILSFHRRSFLITGLFEKQLAINQAPGLYWLYGGGAHIGFYNDDTHYFYYKKHGAVYYYDDYSSAVFGIDLILGLEYKFQGAPITVGLDVKPAFDFIDGLYSYWDGAFTARFVF